MRHMTLDEWDKRVSPYLSTICIRAGWVMNDTAQIRQWIEALPVVPDFRTEALDRLEVTKRELLGALAEIDKAIEAYSAKDKVT